MKKRPWRQTGATKECQCGKEFYCPAWARERKKYCSKQCFFMYKPRGHKHSTESKMKLREAHIGLKHTDETRKKIGDFWRGTKHTEAHRRAIADALRGEKCHFWRGGVTKKNKLIRSSLEYRLWREAVFKRDDFTCQNCGLRGVNLNADHIQQFAYFPELRFSVENGRTLCVVCHSQTPTYKNNKPSYALS